MTAKANNDVIAFNVKNEGLVSADTNHGTLRKIETHRLNYNRDPEPMTTRYSAPLNLRHLRPSEGLAIWPKKWALYSEDKRPEWMVISSRTAGNWPSLKTILSHLEAECLSAAIQADAPFEIVLLENGWQPKPAQLASLKVLILLHVDTQALQIAAACRELFPHIKLVFFLAAEASALCPSFFGHGKILTLTSQDLFITLCRSDAQLVQQVFPGATTQILGDVASSPLPAISTTKTKKFVYAGRISFNKNLHNLVLAYSLALKQQPQLAPLHIYGFQDSSVQQFNETMVQDYQQKLLAVVEQLSLSSHVIFHPYVSGSEWQQLLNEEGLVYVSASLNSDENYALAPREFLARGQRAILPQWGGFRDILSAHPERTCEIPVVRSSDQSVHLDLTQFAQAMLTSWRPCAAQKSTVTSMVSSLQQEVPAHTQLKPSEDIQRLHADLKKMKQEQWHEAGPFRYLHHSSTLVKTQIDAYAPGVKVSAAPATTTLVPWVTQNQSVFEETEKAQEDELWQRGWLY